MSLEGGGVRGSTTGERERDRELGRTMYLKSTLAYRSTCNNIITIKEWTTRLGFQDVYYRSSNSSKALSGDLQCHGLS